MKKPWQSIARRVLLMFFVSCLSACAHFSGDDQAFDDESQVTDSKGEYVVKKGDTLFAIAWKNGIDLKKLAQLNGIPAPYVIKAGQVLKLGEMAPSNNERSRESNASRKLSSQEGYKESKNNAKRIQEKVAKSVSDGVNIAWVWPASGPLVGRFSQEGAVKKGIDLAGKQGDPVLAAADGSVVYSGSGIVGYGNLIIIKHNDVYLSAYAHNSQLLVKEGSLIKAGQKIAEIGSSGTNRDKLHFEIRKYGTPVDPLGYLPKR